LSSTDFADHAPLVTCDQPRIEHPDRIRRIELQRVLPRLMNASDLPLQGL